MRQFVITPAAGKRLIARALAVHPDIRAAVESGTLVIIAGTTNGYVAEEILARVAPGEPFSRKRFFRGITLPPAQPAADTGRLPDESEFPGDVVISKGVWRKGATIFDVVDDLNEGDVILKGANALDLPRRQAAVYIGDPKAGTIGVALQAAVGRRVRLILPVGVEKRVPGDLHDVAVRLNTPPARGPRLFPVPGRAFTELDAVSFLTGAAVELVAAGGVCGAEGSVWLAADGAPDQLDAAEKLVKSVASEPPFER